MAEAGPDRERDRVEFMPSPGAPSAKHPIVVVERSGHDMQVEVVDLLSGGAPVGE
jgi:hypothetical protein